MRTYYTREMGKGKTHQRVKQCKFQETDGNYKKKQKPKKKLRVEFQGPQSSLLADNFRLFFKAMLPIYILISGE